MRSHRYAHSEALLERALQTIPGGTQTFSKSPTQYPHGVSPFYVAGGEGALVRDVDGNEYADFVNGLLAVNLGYRDPDVTEAVQRQMLDGVLFSLPHQIEIEMAERVVAMVPCAEMVRFGKNGSDATAGAIRPSPEVAPYVPRLPVRYESQPVPASQAAPNWNELPNGRQGGR